MIYEIVILLPLHSRRSVSGQFISKMFFSGLPLPNVTDNRLKLTPDLLHYIFLCTTVLHLTFSEGTIIVINEMLEVYKIVKQDKVNPKDYILASCMLKCPKNSNK